MYLNLDFRALAFPEPKLSPCPCSLVFRCDEALKQATVLLVARIPTAHNIQTFVLQYDANRLLPGTVSLSSGNSIVQRSQLDELLRNKDNKHWDIKTLSLSMEQPCPLWCSSAASFDTQPGLESSFRQFVELAKATTIHIAFDYKHLRKEHQGMFKAFSKAARGLVGYPVDRSLTEKGLRWASWEVFGPIDAIGAPPPYDDPCKRSRQVTPTSSNQSPKRSPNESPIESQTSEKTVPLSPAAAAALEKAFGQPSPAHTSQIEIINAAISEQLPVYLKEVLPTAIQSAIAHAPNHVPGSPVSSPMLMSCDGNGHPELPPLTSLGGIFLSHLRFHLTQQFQQYQADQLQHFEQILDKRLLEFQDHMYDIRAQETAEIVDEVEDHKASMSLLKEDTIEDITRQANDILARAKEKSLALGDDMNHRLSELCDTIEKVKDVKLRKMVALEVSRQKRRRMCVSKGVSKKLVRSNRRLLGKRKMEEVVEWLDC